MTDNKEGCSKRQMGLIDNAIAQVERAFKKSNEKSFGTRHTYEESAKRFAAYAARVYSVQNMRNIRNEHIQAYVNELKEDDRKAGYIKTEMSGIRHLLHLIDCKNRIYEKNDRFGIPERDSQALPGMSREEYLKARELAAQKFGAAGRITVDLEYHFGLRINESQAIHVKRFADADKTGILHLDGSDGTKGGRPRDLPVETAEQKQVLKEALAYKAAMGKTNSDRLLTGREKGAVHRAKHAYEKMYANNAEMLNNKSSHDLRRGFAQNLYDRTPGTDKERMRVVCMALGHSPNRDDITARYVARRDK
jgi:site-specific recombinase XerD